MNISALYAIFKKSTGVSTDTRTVEKDNLFFALKGDNFDGNKYADLALAKGATYAVIDNNAYKKDRRYVLVQDVLTTLQELASHHRNQLDIPFIAITGSNGKTTNKELILSVLQKHYKTKATKGNLNNHIGVPLTLLSIDPDIEIAVIEMGANHIGEIDQYCQWVRPTHGLITNIGRAHLEGFGNIDNIRIAKTELYKSLEKQKGTVFINKDNHLLNKEAENIAKQYSYGQTDADVTANLISSNSYLRLQWKNHKIPIQLTGAYNFENALAAIAIGVYFSVSEEKICVALKSYTPKNYRSQILKKNSNTIILDTYNANPSSMHLALENLAQISAQKKVVILGDMKELGTYSLQEHTKTLKEVHQLNADKLILIGKEFEKVKDFYPCTHFANVLLAKEWYDKQKWVDTHILIKGSRCIELEKILA